MGTDISFTPSARGDTFEFAEDDDYDEPSVSPTPPSRRPELDRLKTTQLHIPDFNQRAQHRPETTLEMTRTIQRRVPDRLRAAVAHTDIHPLEDPTTTSAAAEATTAPVTAATTVAPDPDAEVCSGRPFDAFMQHKNGSIYAFRGQ